MLSYYDPGPRESRRHHAGGPFSSASAHRARVLLLLVLAGMLACGALPGAAATGASEKKRSLFPPFETAVPVLLYHQVAPDSFDAQMNLLQDLASRPSRSSSTCALFAANRSICRNARFCSRSTTAASPPWTSADPVLARFGWSAVMYVPTGFVGRPGYLTWDQLRKMQASARWQIEEHAGDGHVWSRPTRPGDGGLTTRASSGRTASRKPSPTTRSG